MGEKESPLSQKLGFLVDKEEKRSKKRPIALFAPVSRSKDFNLFPIIPSGERGGTSINRKPLANAITC